MDRRGATSHRNHHNPDAPPTHTSGHTSGCTHRTDAFGRGLYPHNGSILVQRPKRVVMVDVRGRDLMAEPL